MDVIVNFRHLGIARNSLDDELFLKSFNYVALTPFEPQCPFCGKELNNSICNCKEFNSAYKKLCSSYCFEDVFTRAYETRSSFLSSIKNEDIKTREVSHHNVDYCLFDDGTVVSSNKSNDVWLISTGVFNGKELTFYIRKKGSNNIYHCTISNLVYPPIEYPEVSFYRSYTVTCIHNRRSNLEIRREKIETISYAEFIDKLKNAK